MVKAALNDFSLVLTSPAYNDFVTPTYSFSGEPENDGVSASGPGPSILRQSSRIRKTVDTFHPNPVHKKSNLSTQKRGRHAIFDSLLARKSISKKALVGKKVKRFWRILRYNSLI